MYIRTTQSSESGLGQRPDDWSVQRPKASNQPAKKDRAPILRLRLKQEKNPAAKSQIIDELGFLGRASTSNQMKQSIVTDLIREMENATNTRRVKIAALGALRKIPLDSATGPLLKQLGQENEITKYLFIIPTLGDIGSASTSNQVKQLIVTDLIREMENDKNMGQERSEVKIAAIQALGIIRLKSATEPLLKQFRSRRDERFAKEIIRALGEIGDARAVELLVIVLEKYGPKSNFVDAIEKANFVRIEAAIALGKIRGPKALAALRRRLSQEIDAQVKASISEALIQHWPSEGVSREGLRWRTSPPSP